MLNREVTRLNFEGRPQKLLSQRLALEVVVAETSLIVGIDHRIEDAVAIDESCREDRAPAVELTLDLLTLGDHDERVVLP